MSPDAVDDSIEALLVKATDPEDKAVLVVLLKIANALDDNTKVTRTLAADIDGHRREFAKHQEAFVQHVRDEGLLMARGIGAWKMLVAVLAMVLALGGYILNSHLTQLADAVHRNAEQDRVIYGNLQRLITLERDLEAMQRQARK